MPSRKEALRRCVTYYAQMLYDAEQLYAAGGASVQQGIAIFDSEWLSIRHVHDVLEMAAEEELMPMSIWFPAIAPQLLDLRLPARLRIAWLLPALEKAEKLDQKEARVTLTFNLAASYGDVSEYKKAIECHTSAMDLAGELDDNDAMQIGTNGLGLAVTSWGKHLARSNSWKSRWS